MSIRDKNSEVISSKDSNEIRERYEKMGLNKWVWLEEELEPPFHKPIILVEVHNSGHFSQLARVFALKDENNGSQEVAEFICKAREDIPKLIRAIEQLKEKEKS